jgi:uncharacterized protein
MHNIPAHIVIKRGLNGLGLFTTKPIRKGAQVIEYTGETITTEEANRRGGQYLFALNKSFTIDGRGRENTARYINHSCRPNCRPELSDDETQVHIFAKRNIKAGEELTYNYGSAFWNEYIKPKGCRCKKCTKKD